MPNDDNRTTIDRLIRGWVDAVRAGDLDRVVADHADDSATAEPAAAA